jgi:hypothetical protein
MAVFKKKPKMRQLLLVSGSGPSPLQGMSRTARDACLPHLLANSWRVTEDRKDESGFHRASMRYGVSSPHGTAYNLEVGFEDAFQAGDANFVWVKLSTAARTGIADVDTGTIGESLNAAERAVRAQYNVL